jgi:phosphoribosylglycinamide formyltransferase-1
VKVPVGVLVSGAGTNLQALLDAAAADDYPARIAVVISNRPGVPALDRAARAGVPSEVIPHRRFADRESFEDALVAALRAHEVEWVALAGFVRILTARFLDAFPARILNIHPSLLPAFPGMHAQRQAIDRGVRIAGATVHLADGGTDSGPILAQGAVPVLDGDTEETLRARILAVEHELYPRVLRWACEGRIQGAAVDVPATDRFVWLPATRYPLPATPAASQLE